MDLRAVGWVVLAAIVGVVASTMALPEREQAPDVTGEPRLVSLSPPITETLFAIGAGDQVVGRSEWCQQPEAAKALPSAGSSLALDLEALASLRPTRILTEKVTSEDPASLAEIAPAEVLPWLSLEDVVSSMRRLGELTGESEAANLLADSLQARLGVPEPTEGPTTLLAFAASELGRGEIWYVRPDSIHGAAMRAAGLRNVIEGPITGAPAIDSERLLDLDPDLILILLAEDAPTPEARTKLIEAWNVLEPLSAVKNERIGLLAGSNRMGTGPGILDFADALKAEADRVMGR